MLIFLDEELRTFFPGKAKVEDEKNVNFQFPCSTSYKNISFF
jgi:hypothetical protein